MFFDLQNKLLRSKEIFPELPNGVHELASCIAERINHEWGISPPELALIFAKVLEERKFKDFELFPQLIDKIEEDVFDYDSVAFRKICKQVMGINPPLIILKRDYPQYPENIKVAVEWWVKAIMFREDIESMPIAFQKVLGKTYTEGEVELFKFTLAKYIDKTLKKERRVWIDSKWKVNTIILEQAGNKIGINPFFGYPNATMVIYENEVKVSVDSGKTWKTIFIDS